MPRGTVKWFNEDKGYGFIEQESGGTDVFVHITAVQQAGLQTLKDGAAVSYELETGRDGKKSAIDLRLT
ncbi:cold-shock protein [Paracoccus liaowanqingii]|uniref:Cold-shock protein n=1 Tax=Paracoccus liaowanqingii TaxID=2560053 RepID=A0A4Z1C5I0_9RHOB|nr:cold-shock protein [Paracoccus liaowanqingii]TGN37560.1 cold-shock protein [Paracoccus liaowanqingii]